MFPTRTVITLLVVALAFVGLFTWGMSWKADAIKMEAERDAARTQVAILAESVKACSAGVDEVKKASDAAMNFGQAALAEMKRRNAPVTAQITRLEALIKNPPKGATCDDAWTQIESTAGSQR